MWSRHFGGTSPKRFAVSIFRDARKNMIVKEEQENPLADLTDKQREVLDLLIQHKTSKEISRILGISPHTVDQRISLARAKMKLSSRSEVAQAYRSLIATYERTIYEDSYVVGSGQNGQTSSQENEVVSQQASVSHPVANQTAGSPQRVLISERYTNGNMPVLYYPVLPEAFDGPLGTLVRLGYIAVITLFLVVAVLGGLSMYSELARIVDY